MNIEDLKFRDQFGYYNWKEVKGLLPLHNVSHLTQINGKYYEKEYEKF